MERVVIVHHTAVLAGVCVEQRVLCSLVCRLWVCQGAVRARPRGQQRTWTGTAGTTNPPVYSTHRRCSTCRTLAASISPTTHTSRSLKRTTKLGLVHVGRLTVTHGRQRLNKAPCQPLKRSAGKIPATAVKSTKRTEWDAHLGAHRRTLAQPRLTARMYLPIHTFAAQLKESGGFRVARTTGRHLRERYAHKKGPQQSPTTVTSPPWRPRKPTLLASGSKAEGCRHGHNTPAGCPCAAAARTCGRAEVPLAAAYSSHSHIPHIRR
eukprot:COSAG06_NODE_1006_length_11107_cov_10.602017_5_plen_265_part_00